MFWLFFAMALMKSENLGSVDFIGLSSSTFEMVQAGQLRIACQWERISKKVIYEIYVKWR